MNVSHDYHQINNLNNGVMVMNKYVLVIFWILGNIGNIFSIFIFTKKSWKKNVCVFYFKVCLILNICYLNSTILGAITNFGFNIYLQNSSVILCKLLYYTSFLLTTLPPSVLILASIDRLLISSQNIDTRLYSSKRLAYFSISTCTIFWIIFNCHVLIKIDIYEIYPSYFICSFPQSYNDFVTYSLGTINVLFCSLMIILCIFAFKNVQNIQSVHCRKRHEVRSMTKKDFQLLRCLFVQDIIFITFSMLVIIFYIFEAITKDKQWTLLQLTILNFVDRYVTFLFNISYSTNFFVFMIISKAFRHELKHIIYKCFNIHLQPTRDEEHHRHEHIDRNNVGLNVVIVSTIELPK
ncbi:unnamed protein product [Adineta steineri]|uniref:G-protein coupled receptors family 1 profile domain-containing protein n=1 Tax=Adineta steineri TaxID=433720 RepID=A0A819Q4T9_9BILA|nr:unnamed protein product [Adineta steineri]CAF4023645.1 unnamed protein product [Adineta steineri]